MRQPLLAESSDITGASEEPTTSSEGEATTTLTESKTCVEAIITFGTKVPEAATEAEVPEAGSAKASTGNAATEAVVKVGAAKAAKVGAANAAKVGAAKAAKVGAANDAAKAGAAKAAKVGHWCKAS